MIERIFSYLLQFVKKSFWFYSLCLVDPEYVQFASLLSTDAYSISIEFSDCCNQYQVQLNKILIGFTKYQVHVFIAGPKTQQKS